MTYGCIILLWNSMTSTNRIFAHIFIVCYHLATIIGNANDIYLDSLITEAHIHIILLNYSQHYNYVQLE